MRVVEKKRSIKWADSALRQLVSISCGRGERRVVLSDAQWVDFIPFRI